MLANSKTRRAMKFGGFHTCSALAGETPKTLKGRKPSSQHWIVRQLKDPYVEKAKQENYRCRSAFKLLEINKRFGILTPGQVVVDCGAAPGSWTQVATKLVNADGKTLDSPVGAVFAVDRLPIFPVEGATCLGSCDFSAAETQDKLRELLDGRLVDVVLSDMAPNASGVREIDHDNIMQLVYSAMKFALGISRVGGTFLAKIWDGGRTCQFERDVGRFYKKVKPVKPPASRDESSEKYILGRGFKGLKT